MFKLLLLAEGFSLQPWNWVVLLIALHYCEERILGKVSTFLWYFKYREPLTCIQMIITRADWFKISKYVQAGFCVQLSLSWSLLVRFWLQDFPRRKHLLLPVKTTLFPQNSNLVSSPFLMRQLFPSCLIVSEVSNPFVPWVCL